MSHDRRAVLRGLAALPLAGGAVAPIGDPAGPAEAPSPALLDAYDAWLHGERQWLKWERWGAAGIDRAPDRYELRLCDRETGRTYDAVVLTGLAGFSHRRPMPSARAAGVLAAAGVTPPWRT